MAMVTSMSTSWNGWVAARLKLMEESWLAWLAWKEDRSVVPVSST